MRYVKILRWMSVAATLTALNGCEEFLTPDPKTFIASENFFRNPAELEQGLVGAYAEMRSMFGGSWRNLGEMRGDLTTLMLNINVPGFTFQVDEFTESTNDGEVNSLYNAIFNTVYASNVILTRIDAIEFTDQAQKERMRGEALCLRALGYWMGISMWGLGEKWEPNNLALPLVLEEVDHPDDAVTIERATVKATYDQIVADLVKAKGALPVKASTNSGRCNRGAATFLLGAVHQLNPETQAQEAALAQFAELEAMGYRLVTAGTAQSENNAYRQVFNPSAKNNVESIWEIQYDVSSTNASLRSNISDGMAPLNALGGGNNGNRTLVAVYGTAGGVGHKPTQDFILSFAGADPSRPATPFDLRYEGGYGAFCPGSGLSGRLGGVADRIRTSGGATLAEPNTFFPEVNIAQVRDPVNRTTRNNCIVYYAKWRWPEHMPQSGRDNNNWIVFRYADALLRRAESLVRLGRANEALPFVNQVRARAGLPALTSVNLDQILQERAWELAGEGHRWMDLKRFGKATEIIAGRHGTDRLNRVARTSRSAYMKDGSAYRVRFPIRPRDVELSQCRIVQNPGWGGGCFGQ